MSNELTLQTAQRLKENLLAEFSRQDAPNNIELSLERSEHLQGKLFSPEAIRQMVEMVQLFVAGRVIGMYKATGHEPDKVKITVTIESVEKHVTPGQHRL